MEGLAGAIPERVETETQKFMAAKQVRLVLSLSWKRSYHLSYDCCWLAGFHRPARPLASFTISEWGWIAPILDRQRRQCVAWYRAISKCLLRPPRNIVSMRKRMLSSSSSKCKIATLTWTTKTRNALPVSYLLLVLDCLRR